MPKELSSNNLKNSKTIEPPKGKIASKHAFLLQQSIANQLSPQFNSPLAGHQKVKKL